MVFAVLAGCTTDDANLADSMSSSTDANASTSDDANHDTFSPTGGTNGSSAGPDTTATEGDTSGTSETNAGTLQTADDVYFVKQDESLSVPFPKGVLANDTHTGGRNVWVTNADAMGNEGGTVDVREDGALTYAPAAGFWGLDTFQYAATDEAGDIAIANVSIWVTPRVIPLEQVTAGHGGFALDGGPDDGGVIGGAGDFNGDGIDDVLIGPSTVYGGRTYVVFGGDRPASSSLSAVIADNAGVAMALEDDGGVDATDAAGDVDGDGDDDVLVCARYYYYTLAEVPDPQRGRCYVVFGTAATAEIQLANVVLGVGGFAIHGELSRDKLGGSMSSAGDVNGDGLADVIVATSRGNTIPERAYVVFGKADGNPVEVADIAAGAGGFAIAGVVVGDYFKVSGAGDLDSDGLADLLIGVSGADTPAGTNSGRVYVVWGKADTSPVELPDIADGIGGFAIDGRAAGDWMWVPNALGDVNGDDLPDYVVGEGRSWVGAQRDRSYVIFGTGDRTPVELEDIAAGVGGFMVDGTASNENAKYSSDAGDVTGDGLADIAISDTSDSPASRNYVVFGKSDTTPVAIEDLAEGKGGYAIARELGDTSEFFFLSGAGDLDDDGISDLVVGSPWYTDGANGRSWIVYGMRTSP